MFEKWRLPTHACVLAGLLVLGLTAHAQSPSTRGVALNWVRLPGAESCIAAVDLAQRVEQRLGRPVFSRASDAIIAIEGRVEPAQGGGFTTVIRVSDPDGTLYGSRELSVSDPDCHRLDAVAALVISITIRRQGDSGISLPASIAAQLDGLFADDASELDPTELPAPVVENGEVASAAPSPAPASELPRPAEAAAFLLGVEAGMAMFTGAAPTPSLAPMLRARLRRPGLGSLALEGQLGIPQEQRIASESSGTLAYRAYSLALLGCAVALEASMAELSVCAGARLGSLGVDAHDFVHSYGARQLWLELAASASVRAWLVGPTYAQLRLGLPWRVIRPRFQYEDSMGTTHEAFTMARFGVDLALALGIEF